MRDTQQVPSANFRRSPGSLGSVSDGEENFDDPLVDYNNMGDSETANFEFDGQSNLHETITSQANRIQKLQEEEPLLSKLSPIVDIAAMYPENNVINSKLINMTQVSNTHCHRSRGDGNCFYRCFAFGLIRFLVERATPAQRTEMKDKIKMCYEELVRDFGYPDFTTMDIHEMFDDVLGEIYQKMSGNLLPEQTLDEALASYFNDQNYDSYIVSTFRFLTSLGLQKKQDEYIHYLENLDAVGGMKGYCNREVECQNKDADQIHIMALVGLLQVSVKVSYVDLSPGNSANVHNFGDEWKQGEIPHINLLYRPGHYDLLI